MAITSDFISPWPQTHALFLNDIYFYMLSAAKSLQSCSTLCDPIDSSPPGSAIHGIFQARVVEWVAIAFSEHPSNHALIRKRHEHARFNCGGLPQTYPLRFYPYSLGF